jgi:hypothetical protein
MALRIFKETHSPSGIGWHVHEADELPGLRPLASLGNLVAQANLTGRQKHDPPFSPGSALSISGSAALPLSVHQQVSGGPRLSGVKLTQLIQDQRGTGMGAGYRLQEVAGGSPSLGEAATATATPDTSRDHQSGTLAEGRAADEVHPAALIVEQISNRAGKSDRDRKDEARVAGRWTRNLLDPLVKRTAFRIPGSVGAAIVDDALADLLPHGHMRKNEHITVPAAAADQAHPIPAIDLRQGGFEFPDAVNMREKLQPARQEGPYRVAAISDQIGHSDVVTVHDAITVFPLKRNRPAVAT